MNDLENAMIATCDNKLDPITLEVIRNKLEGIANEMQQTLLLSSFSPIVKEGRDASASLFTLQGETLAQAIAVPIHLATLIPVVATTLSAFPAAKMTEGDVYILNDPYLGGTHCPDIALVMPVFAQGRPIALSATMAHHQDVGGMSPGSVPTNATEIFQEGLRIPLLKYRDAGKPNDTLISIIRQNVRIPEIVLGDLNAQLAACNVGARRLGELANEVGVGLAIAIFDELLDQSEKLTRAALSRLPSGTYRYVDYSDNDGIALDENIRFEVAVTIRDGSIHCDLTGSSSQVKGPFNCVPSGSLAAVCYAMRAITDPNIPTNGGCFRPISLHLPEGTIVNPIEPAPVNARTATIKRILGCVLGALKDVVPERIPADTCGEVLVLVFGGRRENGSAFVTGELIAGGSGASASSDGVDVIETDVSNCMNLPVEAMEMDIPIRVHQLALRNDSGGAGRYRGGLGITKEYEILHGDVTFTHRGERHFHAPQGSQGGAAGAKAVSIIERAGGSREIIPSKLVTTLHRGDRIIIETAGGGGYGPAKERDQSSLMIDLANEKVTEAGSGTYESSTKFA